MFSQYSLCQLSCRFPLNRLSPSASAAVMMKVLAKLSAERQRFRRNERSDIYAFGCVACESFTGHAPFISDSPLGYLALHTSAHPTIQNPVTSVRSQKWRERRQLIYRCLEKDPSNRFASAAALHNHIEALQSKPESIVDSHRWTDLTQHLALAVVAAGLVVGTVVLLSQWYKPESQDRIYGSRTPCPVLFL